MVEIMKQRRIERSVTTLVPAGDGCDGCCHIELECNTKWCAFFDDADICDGIKCEDCKAAYEKGYDVPTPGVAAPKTIMYMWNTSEMWEGKTDGELYDTRSDALIAGLEECGGDVYVGEHHLIDMDSLYLSSLDGSEILERIKEYLNDIVGGDLFDDEISAEASDELADMLLPALKTWLKKHKLDRKFYVMENIKHFNRTGEVE